MLAILRCVASPEAAAVPKAKRGEIFQNYTLPHEFLFSISSKLYSKMLCQGRHFCMFALWHQTKPTKLQDPDSSSMFNISYSKTNSHKLTWRIHVLNILSTNCSVFSVLLLFPLKDNASLLPGNINVALFFSIF